jgi:TonB family protein
MMLNWILSMIAMAGHANAQSTPVAPPPPPPSAVQPPVIRTVQTPPPAYRQSLITQTISGARCDGVAVPELHREMPLPMQPSFGLQRAPDPVVLRFRIDETGRPLSMTSDSAALPNQDYVPALAAWRFAPGQPRANCSITIYPVLEDVAEASLPLLQRQFALARFAGRLPKSANDRLIELSGADCQKQRPPVLNMAYPDSRRIAAPPGSIAHSLIQFDVDSAGRPTDIRTVSSDGNAALDAAVRQAMGKWRMAEGPRTGCLYSMYRNQIEPMSAPAAPEKDAVQPANAFCVGDAEWDRAPNLVYPENFRRRAIEGWALIAYDFAPWGDIGNVRVLAAEPAAAFGQAAERVIRTARRKSAPQGGSGCVERVVFRMRTTLPESTPEGAELEF